MPYIFGHVEVFFLCALQLFWLVHLGICSSASCICTDRCQLEVWLRRSCSRFLSRSPWISIDWDALFVFFYCWKLIHIKLRVWITYNHITNWLCKAGEALTSPHGHHVMFDVPARGQGTSEGWLLCWKTHMFIVWVSVFSIDRFNL